MSSLVVSSARSRLRTKLTSRQRKRAWATAIADKATKVGLSPDLPEFGALLKQYRDSGAHEELLAQIDPTLGTSRHGSTLIVNGPLYNRVLRPETIIDFHLGHGVVRNRTAGILIDPNYLHYYDIDANKLAQFQGDPSDQKSITNRIHHFNRASELITRHTGRTISRSLEVLATSNGHC